MLTITYILKSSFVGLVHIFFYIKGKQYFQIVINTSTAITPRITFLGQEEREDEQQQQLATEGSELIY